MGSVFKLQKGAFLTVGDTAFSDDKVLGVTLNIPELLRGRVSWQTRNTIVIYNMEKKTHISY